MKVDVAIIGGGSGGYVAARRAVQLGMSAAVVECRHLGGVCLNRGCIPTKTMLQAVSALGQMRRAADYGVLVPDKPRIDYATLLAKREEVVGCLRNGMGDMLEAAGIPLIPGHASFVGPNRLAVSRVAPEAMAALVNPAPHTDSVEAGHIIVATGSKPAGLPSPGADHPRVIDSDGLLGLRHLPDSIVVVGAGAIGCEWSHILAGLGCRVTLVTRRAHVLPREDPDIAAVLAESLTALGATIHTRTCIGSIAGTATDVTVHLDGDGPHSVTAEYVLTATGRLPLTDGLGLDVVGVETEGPGWVRVDDHFRTNVPSVSAIGDVTGTCLLAHAAFRQAVIAVERLAGLDPGPACAEHIPYVVYTEPEVASVGLTEAEARERGLEITVGVSPGMCNARAVTRGQPEGLTKVVAEAATGRILGVHMAKAEAGELIAEAVSAISRGWTAEELGEVVRPHPALCEAMGEAALAAAGRALFLP